MKKYAIVKDGAITYVTEGIPTKQEYFSEEEMARILEEEKAKVDAMTTEELLDYAAPSNIKVPGIEYDEAVPFDFEGRPVLVDGKVVPDPEPAKLRKAEIVQMLGKLSDTRKGLESLGEPTGEVDADIETLKTEYATLS